MNEETEVGRHIEPITWRDYAGILIPLILIFAAGSVIAGAPKPDYLSPVENDVLRAIGLTATVLLANFHLSGLVRK